MESNPSDTRDVPTKKPYTKPELRVYGTVAALTSSVSMGGTVKDGGPNNTKT